MAPFARDPDVLPEVMLHLREIVVAIDALALELGFVAGLAIDVTAQLAEHAVHHLLAIEQRKMLRPMQVAQVVIELLGAFA